MEKHIAELFMRHALRLASQGLGRTWPNPSVGCIVVKDGRILAASRTADSGRPHAEALAVAQAGHENLKGATAYIALEPCAHREDSCAHILAASGIARIVIACRDPDPRTNGWGVALLKKAGIEVMENICEKEARAVNAGFFRRIEKHMPLLTIKTATSLDGFIADAAGESQWITGEDTRNHGHLLRANHDAIITGINTILADDPLLTCRLEGLENYSPVRVMLDSQLRFPLQARLAQSAGEIPVWIVTASEDRQKHEALRNLGITVKTVSAHNGHVDAKAALHWLAEQGITRVLAEGGAALNAHLLPFAQELYWYRAPIIIGEGKSAFAGYETGKTPSGLTRFHKQSIISLGADTLEIYQLAE
jgi:diaminohydroxyphosphoribosylaminopyrimidine deaminase / 5-amino-6-(5-phosphoribosylamino)uracil reductase